MFAPSPLVHLTGTNNEEKKLQEHRFHLLLQGQCLPSLSIINYSPSTKMRKTITRALSVNLNSPQGHGAGTILEFNKVCVGAKSLE